MAFSWTGFGFLLGLLETCSLLVEESDIVVEQVRERCVCWSLIIKSLLARPLAECAKHAHIHFGFFGTYVGHIE